MLAKINSSLSPSKVKPKKDISKMFINNEKTQKKTTVFSEISKNIVDGFFQDIPKDSRTANRLNKELEYQMLVNDDFLSDFSTRKSVNFYFINISQI